MKLLRRPATWQLAIVAAACVVAYLPALSRPFVSEDFPTLRLLSEGGFWETALAQFTGPWLGITFIKFYRPVSTLALHLELLLWGARPTPFLVAHLLVHLVNAALLYHLARHLARRLARHLAERDGPLPMTAALLFALYPLHPNTVVFVASFATLFSATACLASLLLFVHGRLAGSVAAFALALGSYEAAAVLPGIVLGLELIFGPRRASPRGWRGVARRQLPFLAVLAGYLGVRWAALGAPVGGYGSFAELLSGGRLGQLLANARIDWLRFLYPDFGCSPSELGRWTVAAVLAVATVWSLVRLRGGRGGENARWWLLAMLWIVTWQLPYNVVGAVPGNGRYWYLSAAGLGFLVAAVSGLLPRAWRHGGTVTLAVLLGSAHLHLLRQYVDLHVEAGATARTLRTAVERAALGPAEAGAAEPIFLVGHPPFVEGRFRVPVAQVFHWGLSDAFRPPFVERELSVYPLPRFADERLGPLLERPELGRVWRWQAGELRPVTASAAPPAAAIAVRLEGTGPRGLRIRFDALPGAQHRLVVLARGHPVFRPIATAGGWSAAPLPWSFLESMETSYGGALYWWIEATARDGRPLAFSQLAQLPRMTAPP